MVVVVVVVVVGGGGGSGGGGSGSELVGAVWGHRGQLVALTGGALVLLLLAVRSMRRSMRHNSTLALARDSALTDFPSGPCDGAPPPRAPPPEPEPDAWDELLAGDDERVPFALAKQQAAATRQDYGIGSAADAQDAV